MYKELGRKENICKSLIYLEEGLKMNKELFPGNHPYVANSLDSLGLAHYNLEGKDNLLKGLKYIEEAFKMRQLLFPGNYPAVGNSLIHLGLAYNVLGDIHKTLEYFKQAYSIFLAIKDYTFTEQIKTNINSLQPNFFEKQGLKRILQENKYLGGNGNSIECEYRWIITVRGEISTRKIEVKQKIQKTILDKIIQTVNDYGWSNYGILGEWGVKGYIQRDYLKKKMNEMSINENDIEFVQMLCFEAMNLAIIKLEEKPYNVVKNFTRENPELVKKIALEHPEFFIDGSIVEACIRGIPNDLLFAEHILKHVKYMGMKERRMSRI